MSKKVLDFLMESKIIAIVRGIPSDDIVKLGEALKAGGIRCMEVTFDQSSEEKAKDTLKAIKALTDHFGDTMAIGAGTVMSVEQVLAAKEAGAQYIISPNVNEEVIRRTVAEDLVSIPGALTPTEVANAYSYGAHIVKMFPAGVLGVDYIKAVRAPLKHIPMSAVGGVSPENCASFFRAGCCSVGCGGNLVSAKLVAEGRFDIITETAEAYMKALQEV